MVKISFLDGKIPNEWSLVLVDNPGFGEANELIKKTAAESWGSSAGYVYVTVPGRANQATEVDIYKECKEKGVYM